MKMQSSESVPCNLTWSLVNQGEQSRAHSQAGSAMEKQGWGPALTDADKLVDKDGTGTAALGEVM